MTTNSSNFDKAIEVIYQKHGQVAASVVKSMTCMLDFIKMFLSSDSMPPDSLKEKIANITSVAYAQALDDIGVSAEDMETVLNAVKADLKEQS